MNPASIIIDARDSVDRSFAALFRARASQPVAAPLKVALLLGDTPLALGSHGRAPAFLLLQAVTRISARIVRLELRSADAAAQIKIPWFSARLASAVDQWSRTLLVALPASGPSRRFVANGGPAGYSVRVGRNEVLVAYASDVSSNLQRLVLRESPRFRVGHRARLQEDASAGQITANVSFEALPALRASRILAPLERPTVVFRSARDEHVSVHQLVAVTSAGAWVLDSVLQYNFDASSRVDILEQSSDVMDVAPIVRIESVPSDDLQPGTSPVPPLLDATAALLTVPEAVFQVDLAAAMCPNTSVPWPKQSISMTDEVKPDRASVTTKCELLPLQSSACLDPESKGSSSAPTRTNKQPRCSKVMPATLQSSFVHRIALNNKWRIPYADQDMRNRHNIIDTTVLYNFFSDRSPAEAASTLFTPDVLETALLQFSPKKLVYGTGAGSGHYESFATNLAADMPTLSYSVRLQMDSKALSAIKTGRAAGVADLWPKEEAGVRRLLQQFEDVEFDWDTDAIGAPSDGQLELIPGQVYTMKASVTILPHLERSLLGSLALTRWTCTQHSKDVFRQENTDPAMRNVVQIRYVIEVDEDVRALVASLKWSYAEYFVYCGGIALFSLAGYLLLRAYVSLRQLWYRCMSKARESHETVAEMMSIVESPNPPELIRRMSE
jgi:hypothetical protein